MDRRRRRSGSDRTSYSLVPIGLQLKGQDLQATELQLAGEIEVNPVLLHIFNKELNVASDRRNCSDGSVFDRALVK